MRYQRTNDLTPADRAALDAAIRDPKRRARLAARYGPVFEAGYRPWPEHATRAARATGAPSREGVCARCRKPRQIRTDGTWCDECRGAASTRAQKALATRETRREEARATGRYIHRSGHCEVCGGKINTESKSDTGPLVHRKCRPMWAQGARA